MGNVAPIVLPDAQTTPVDHTFEPSRVGEALVIYHDRSPGTFLEYPSISIGNRLPSPVNENYKTTIKVRLPVLVDNTANPELAPALAYALSANVDIVIPARSTAQERADLQSYLSYLLAGAVVADAINDMEIPY